MITDLADLEARIKAIQHQTIGSLAASLGLTVPNNLNYHKGWLGQLFELALGTDAGCQSKPDFTHLGIELKTIPVNANGLPLESTYVCTVPLQALNDLNYESSVVCAKLSHVLWVPILTEAGSTISSRPILTPLLWRPDPTQYEILRTDFDELMDLIAMGDLSSITASMGTALHIRPKAAHARVLTQGINPEGLGPTLPRGFYLRSQFTAEILKASCDGAPGK